MSTFDADILLAMKPWTVSEEQKEYYKGEKGIGDQHNIKESKTKRKNVAMTWIDYKKVYDMVSQRWIVDCQKCTRDPIKS